MTEYKNLKEKLLQFIADKKSLNFFSQSSVNWKKFFNNICEDEELSYSEISFFAKEFNNNLPLEKWLDVSSLKTQLENYFKKQSFLSLLPYSWCMECSQVRKQFTSEEKGKFLEFGFYAGIQSMAYSASLDNDWIRPHTTLFIENVLLSEAYRCHYESDDKEQINEKHINWLIHDIFPKYSSEDQLQPILVLFALCFNQLNADAFKNNLSTLGLEEVSLEEETVNWNNISQQIKILLGIEEWSQNDKDDFVKEILENTENYKLKQNKLFCYNLFDKIMPIFQQQHLNKILSMKSDIQKKVKI